MAPTIRWQRAEPPPSHPPIQLRFFVSNSLSTRRRLNLYTRLSAPVQQRLRSQLQRPVSRPQGAAAHARSLRVPCPCPSQIHLERKPSRCKLAFHCCSRKCCNHHCRDHATLIRPDFRRRECSEWERHKPSLCKQALHLCTCTGCTSSRLCQSHPWATTVASSPRVQLRGDMHPTRVQRRRPPLWQLHVLHQLSPVS